MSLRHVELLEVVAELGGGLTGAVAQKAWAPRPRLCFLELRQVGRSILLCASAEPGLARLSVAAARPPSPLEPAPFQHRLRQEVVGARLAAVGAGEDDRVAWLDFDRGEQRRRLLVELKGSGGDLFLLAPDGTVLASSDTALASRRGLGPGAVYPGAGGALSEEARRLSSRLVPVPGAAFPLAEAAEALHAEAAQSQRADALRRALLGPLRARLARTVRTLEKVRAEAGRGAEAEEHRRRGELLSRNLHLLRRGAPSARLVEYTSEGPREVELPLEPRRTPKEQADWHFHQYRRLLRGAEAAGRRMGELERERDELARRVREVEALPDGALLAREPAVAPERPGPGPAPRPGVARPYKEFFSAKGERILVGKGSGDNDELTFKIARPHDLWLHARGVSGAHVVVPLERGAALPQELLLDAAHLALHHSGARGEPRGEVSYTFAKFVRRPKGASPGQVTYTREKTFAVRLEPERLERLLRTRAGGG